MAFDGMSFIIEGKQQTITDGAGDHKNGADVNCMALTVATGFPQALTQTPWTFNPGALPGLNGQTVEMPANLLFAAAVTHDGDTTGLNSFKAASDYVSGLDGTTIENTTITLGMDTEIDGGKYQKSDGDMPAKPCTIEGGGHKLTATTQNIYLNADAAMANIKVGGTSTLLNASSYDNKPHKLTLGEGFSAQGSISGNGRITGGSQLQVDADIDCNSLGNFSNVSLDDDVTVTLASGGVCTA